MPSKQVLAPQFDPTDFVDGSVCDVVETVRELTIGGVQHLFEAVGLIATAEQAFAIVRRGGTANIIGLIPGSEIVRLVAATSWARSASRDR